MAHFRGTVRGSRGQASRLGTKRSGLTVTCNGWGIGVKAIAGQANGEDVIDIYSTGGSYGQKDVFVKRIYKGAYSG